MSTSEEKLLTTSLLETYDEKLKSWISVNFTKSKLEDVCLENNLYAYTNIGKITGASNTKPVLVANAGDDLGEVFKAVFGTQQDQDPSITAAIYELTKTQQTTVTAGGGEIGATVEANDNVTITFKLDTTAGTAPYGYVYKDANNTEVFEKVSKSFYYPIAKQSGGDVKITLPAGKTAIIENGYGSIEAESKSADSSTNNILYCNFNNSKEVRLKISLGSDTVENSNKIRYDTISASVTFGEAQTDSGSKIDAFLTFFGEKCDTESVKAHLTKNEETASSTAYTITKGSLYNYYAITSSPEVPTDADITGVFSLGTATEKDGIMTSDNTYLWFIMEKEPTNKKIQQFAMNQWNNLPTTDASGKTGDKITTDTAKITFTTKTDRQVTYYAYRTDKLMAATGMYRTN